MLGAMGYSDLILKLGHQRWFARVARTLVPVDRALQKATGGRWSVIGKGVVPEMLLTTTGRKTGLPRDVPVLYAKDGEAYVVVASNWGQEHHPAWSGNLLAEPKAVVTVDGRAIDVVAELADPAEKERVWPLVTAVWPAYDTYAARAGRDIRVFLLRPTTS
jgi:deazaflavin-dependent oxidoreductase (nitroreductase family)